MKRNSRLIGRFFVPVLLLCVISLSAHASDGSHTTVRLVADVSAVRPGETFTVGVLMTMEKGWHTYWKNSGEAGLPTEIQWTLPRGFTAGEAAWPVPEKHLEAGDVLTYGYTNETMLLVPVTAPAGLAEGSRATLEAEISWLECEKICVPGSARATLTLPVVLALPPAANTKLFGRYRELIPRPAAAVPGLSLETTFASGGRVSLRGRLEGAEGRDGWDFYPEALGALEVGRTEVTSNADGAMMTIPLSSGQPVAGKQVLRGVVIYPSPDGTRRGADLELVLDENFLATVKGAGSTQGPAVSILEREFTTVQGPEAGQSLALYLLFALVGGVLLNIMPCVLPVIALKIFGLVKMAGHEPARTRRLGWVFSLGILASFLVLALAVIVLKLAGQQVGWGFQFQEPLFVIIMTAVVFAFGLSLFGVYEIRLPGAAVSQVSALVGGQQGKGYAASFSEGVFATVLATPCTAPFLGSALGFAFAQPPGIILLIFACVALGMALPYLLITARPAWLKFLPKPGEWMVTAKQFMGFLMMATVLWLLYVLGKQLGMEAVVWTLAFLLAVGCACWLVGRFVTLSAPRSRVIAIWVLAAVLTVAGYVVFIDAILDVRSVIGGQRADDSGEEEIAWQPFSLARLEEELASGRPVFLDFTAEWCLTCKVNERTVLGDRQVVEKFRGSGIVAIKADWTNRHPDITRLLQKFGRSGVPLYVVFPAGNPGAPDVLPEVITPSMVIEAIERAIDPGAAIDASHAPGSRP